MKRIIVILTLVTVLFSVVTAGMIVNKKIQIAKYNIENETISEVNTEKDKEIHSEKVVLYQEFHLPIKDNVKGASASQMFDINPIHFTEHVYEDEETYAIYLEIDGLKDKRVEKEINNTLKSEIIDYGKYAYNYIKNNNNEYYNGFIKYDKNKSLGYDDNNDKWNSCVREVILFNGNNVLSIGLIDYQKSYLSEYSNGQTRFLNFNLINGNKIKIEELFTSEYNIADYFSKKLYYQLGEGEIKWEDRSRYNEVTGELEWIENDGIYERVNVEEQERIVKKFKYTEDIQFGFTDQAAIINFENYNVVIKFDTLPYEYIALFNRFKTNENIFDERYSSPRNVPAFKNMSAGNILKYSRTFEQDEKVVLNYYIKYNGQMADEEKYAKAIDFAINKINEMVNVDIRMINENYKGDNLILYSGAFDIILGNNKIKDDAKAKYNQYLKTDVEFVTFSFKPEVFEIKKNDFEYVKDNLNKFLYGNCESITTEIGIYNPKTYEWVSEYKLEKPIYELYYNKLRSYFYDGGQYYNNIFKDFYIISDNYILVDGNDLLDYLVTNKEGLVQEIFDNSPTIWNYEQINRNNYSIKASQNGNIEVSFPYMAYYTQEETESKIYYSTRTFFTLENNTISRNRLFKTNYN